jgi:hypothetical protein
LKAKLRKILLALLLGLLLFAGLAVVLLRSRPVQQFVAGKIAAYLSKEWQVKVVVGGLETDFFHAITLERILIKDRSQDTLFSFRRLHARIASINTGAHIVRLSLFECSNGLVNLGIHKNDSGQNINFLIDYFTPKKKGTGPKIIWELRAQNAVLRNMEYRNFDDQEPAAVPGYFDPYHLTFRRINAQLDTFMLYDDSMHFGIRTLKAKERSGLVIKDLKSQCRISYYAMDFLGFRLSTARSEIGDTLRFRYQGYKAFSDFNEAVILRGRLNNSHLGLADLGVFQSSMRERPDAITIGTEFKGKLSSLRFKKMDIRYGSRGIIQCGFSLNGLPDWKNTFIDATVQKWETNASDLGVLLGGVRIPSNLNSLGVFHFTGSFTGFYNQFTANGHMSGASGDLFLDGLSMNFREGYNKAHYEGNLRVDQFNLGSFYSLEPLMGKVNAAVHLQGSGLNKDNFNIQIQGLVSSFELNSSVLRDAKVDGMLTPSSFSGDASLNDPKLSFNLNGDIRFAGEQPQYRFTSFDLVHADLHALGFDSASSILACSGNSDISYSAASDINGAVALNNIHWNRSGIDYFIPYAQFTAAHSGPVREWTLRSQIGDAGLRGNFHSGNLAPSFSGLLHELLPELVSAPLKKDTSVKLDYYFNLRNGKLPASFLGKQTTLGPMMLKGAYSALGNAAELNSEQPFWITLNGNSLRNIEVHCSKKPALPLEFSIRSDRFSHAGNTWFRNLNLSGTIHHGHMPWALDLQDSTGGNSISLAAEMDLQQDSIPITFQYGRLNWFGSKWVLDTVAGITYRKGDVAIQNFFLGSDRNYIEMNGVAGISADDELRVSFGNFNVSDIQPFLGSFDDSFAASLNGTLTMRGTLSDDIYAECDILATGIRYNGMDYGDFRLEASSLDVGKRIWLDGMATKGMFKGATLRGTAARAGEDEGPGKLNLDINIPRETSLLGLRPFLEGVVDLKKGFLMAKLRVEGTTAQPILKGDFEIRELQFSVDYTKVSYAIPALRGKADRNIISVIPFHIVDETGRGKAIGQASIKHEYFRNFYIDAEVAGANNLKAINTGPKDNSLFYGVGYADGSAKFVGPWNKLDMEFNLKSRKNTLISIPITETSSTGPVSFVSFRKKNEQQDHDDAALAAEESNSINSITVNLEMTSDAEVRLIFDEKMGDIMKGNGTGDLRLTLDAAGNFNLMGQFTVAGGEYLFTALDLINKKFYVNKGGTITWNGDPYDALINIQAEYRQKVSPAVLMAGRNISQTVSYPVMDVVSKLSLKGKLFQPDIRFDLEFPNMQNATSGTNLSDLNATLQRIRSDQDEVARQVFGLLVLGNFIPPSFSVQGNTASAGAEAAGSTVSGLISNQLNNWLSQFGGKFRLTLNMESISQSSQNSNRVSVNVKVPLFNDRLMIDGTYDPTVSLPNVNVEYSITQDGTFRVKAYSRNANQLYQAPGSSSNMSTNTMGLGLFYRREFERWVFSRKAKAEFGAPK